MKSFLFIIPRNLMKNKKRTISVAISIVLSIGLITSIEILFNGVINAYVRDIQAASGDYYASYLKVHYDSIIRLKQDDRIDNAGVASLLGYAYMGSEIISLNGMDDEVSTMLGMNLSDGNYPKGENEIVAEKRFLSKSFPDAKIGDTINLVFDIQQYDQITHETTKNKRNLEFVLCGIIDDLGGAYSGEKAALFLNQTAAEKVISPEKMTYNLFFTTSTDSPVKDTVEWFNSKYGDDYKRNYQINYNRVNSVNTYQKSRKVVVILDIMVAFACSILIYNLINISIAERIKQFGLLKSIGITPNQIKMIVIGEALLIGTAFIPIGIIFGVNITNFFINILSGIGNMRLQVDSSCYNIISITGAGILSLLLASYNPARMVSKISVLEGIIGNKCVLKRNKSYGSISNRASKVNRGYIWKMAYMNLIRNSKRFLATAISIGICVMTFLSINYSINAINPLNAAKLDAGSDFILSINVGFKNLGFDDEDIRDIENIKGIKNVVKYKYLRGKSTLNEKNMTSTGVQVIKAEDNITVKQLANEGKYDVFIYLVGCSKEQMNEIKRKMPDINKEKVNEDNYPTAIAYRGKEGERYVNLNPGDKVNISWMTAKDVKPVDIKGQFVIESAVDELPFKIRMENAGVLLLTEEENILKLFGLNGYQKINIYADKNGDINEIENKLRAIANSKEDGKIDSHTTNVKMIKELKGDILIILYLLFSIIIAFALVNITNTMSMNIITRKQEFGMLRAIGTNKNQLRMMITIEGFLYGIVGSFFGTIMGLILAYQIYKSINGVFTEEMRWEFQPAIIAAVFITAVIITIISTLIPLKKATDMEIVDSIRAIE